MVTLTVFNLLPLVHFYVLFSEIQLWKFGKLPDFYSLQGNWYLTCDVM